MDVSWFLKNIQFISVVGFFSPRMKTAFFLFDLAETGSTSVEEKAKLYTLAYKVRTFHFGIEKLKRSICLHMDKS